MRLSCYKHSTLVFSSTNEALDSIFLSVRESFPANISEILINTTNRNLSFYLPKSKILVVCSENNAYPPEMVNAHKWPADSKWIQVNVHELSFDEITELKNAPESDAAFNACGYTK